VKPMSVSQIAAMPTYIISLKNAHERRRSIRLELAKAQIDKSIIFDAFNGHDPFFPFDSYKQFFSDFWGDAASFKPGAFACYLSHAECWRMIADGNEPYALILEDDACLSAEAIKQFAIKTQVDQPERFDVIFVNARVHSWINLSSKGRVRGRFIRILEKLRDSTNGNRLERRLFLSLSTLFNDLVRRRIFLNDIPAVGADGYIVSRGGASKLIQMMHSRKICMGVDYAMLFNSLDSENIDALRKLKNVPKALDYFLSAESQNSLQPVCLKSYVYTVAPLVSEKNLSSTINHGSRLNSSIFQ
jgi:GR25 family glycosyltransferase involved in LPS biosynthesis